MNRSIKVEVKFKIFILTEAEEDIFKTLPRIHKAVDKGSVITKDAGISVYANLASIKNQKAEVLPMLFDEPNKINRVYKKKRITML